MQKVVIKSLKKAKPFKKATEFSRNFEICQKTLYIWYWKRNSTQFTCTLLQQLQIGSDDNVSDSIRLAFRHLISTCFRVYIFAYVVVVFWNISKYFELFFTSVQVADKYMTLPNHDINPLLQIMPLQIAANMILGLIFGRMLVWFLVI